MPPLSKIPRAWLAAIAVLAIGLVATVALALAAQRELHRASLGAAEARLAAASGAAASAVRARYEAVAADLSAQAADPALADALSYRPGAEPRLERQREARGHAAVVVLRHNGEIIARSGDLPDRDALDALAQAAARADGRPVFARSDAAQPPDLAAVALGGPLAPAGGVLAYALSGAALDALAEAAGDEGARVRVIGDEAGPPVAPDAAQGAAPGTPWVARGIVGASGASMLAAYAPIEIDGARFAIVAEQDLAGLAGPAAKLRNRLVIGGLLATLSAAALAAWAGRRQARRLRAVEEAVAALGDGAADAKGSGADRLEEADALALPLAALRDRLARNEAGGREAAIKAGAFDEAAAALMILGRDGRVTHANAALRALLSARAGDLRKLWPDLDPGRVVGAPIASLRADPSSDEAPFADPARLPDAAEIRAGERGLSLRLAPLRDARGQPAGVLLEWSESGEADMNARVLDAIRDHHLVAEYTLDGVILGANESLQTLLGDGGAPVVGRPASEFADAEDRAAHDELWRRLREGESVAGRFQVRSQQGRALWLDAFFNAVLDSEGRPFRVVQIATDATAPEGANRLRATLVDALGHARARLDLDPSGRILDANAALLSMTGHAREDVVGQPRLALLPEEGDGAGGASGFWQALGDGRPRSGLLRLLAKAGEERILQADGIPVPGRDGRVDRIVVLASDVTAIERDNAAARDERDRMAATQRQVVDALRAGLGALAEGDLTYSIDDAFREEHEQLRLDFNRALGTLRGAMGLLTQTSRAIRSGAGEISAAADDLSHRTENQAATLEETAAALDQLTASVRSAADGAAQAASAVARARSEAEQSGETVLRAVGAMNRIERSSEQISRIIGVIDDIAFQTNLLALNAGVEAARAGEAGRGFAVVASEVRALAQRSSEAAKEIKALISESSEQVRQGVDLVGQAGSALSHIVTRVGEIAERVGEIASSAREQSTGLGEINTGVNLLDQVTQQNAAMVEESTAASHALSQEAERLTGLVSRFRTGEEAEEAEVIPFATARGPARKEGKPAARRAATAGASGAAEGIASGEWHDF